jgi:hypothetical protein
MDTLGTDKCCPYLRGVQITKVKMNRNYKFGTECGVLILLAEMSALDLSLWLCTTSCKTMVYQKQQLRHQWHWRSVGMNLGYSCESSNNHHLLIINIQKESNSLEVLTWLTLFWCRIQQSEIPGPEETHACAAHEHDVITSRCRKKRFWSAVYCYLYNTLYCAYFRSMNSDLKSYNALWAQLFDFTMRTVSKRITLQLDVSI